MGLKVHQLHELCKTHEPDQFTQLDVPKKVEMVRAITRKPNKSSRCFLGRIDFCPILPTDNNTAQANSLISYARLLRCSIGTGCSYLLPSKRSGSHHGTVYVADGAFPYIHTFESVET